MNKQFGQERKIKDRFLFVCTTGYLLPRNFHVEFSNIFDFALGALQTRNSLLPRGHFVLVIALLDSSSHYYTVTPKAATF